jgi:hypothetical protein
MPSTVQEDSFLLPGRLLPMRRLGLRGKPLQIKFPVAVRFLVIIDRSCGIYGLAGLDSFECRLYCLAAGVGKATE